MLGDKQKKKKKNKIYYPTKLHALFMGKLDACPARALHLIPCFLVLQ